MIAIMILGLGLVMVATIFPVSLDMTRTTLQMNITNTIFDSAEAVLRVRLAGYASALDGIENDLYQQFPATDPVSQMVLWPDMATLQFEAGSGTPVLTSFEAAANDPAGSAGVSPASAKVGFRALNDWSGTSVVPLFNAWWTTGTPSTDYAAFKLLNRIYTEATFWDAEQNWDFRQVSCAIAGQNIQSSTRTIVNEWDAGSGVDFRPPFLEYPNLSLLRYPRPPRIHIADRVYPAIEVEWRWSEPLSRYVYAYFNRATNSYDAMDDLTFANMVMNGDDTYGELPRRYAWSAFHRQSGDTLGDFANNPSFICTIVALYRGDLTSRYPRQQPPADEQFSLVEGNADMDLMRSPQAMSADYDTAFPQPWLVLLNSADPTTGIINCSITVGNMLPAGAYFIAAQDKGGFTAGMPVKIARVNGVSGTTAILEMDKSASGGAVNLPVWVFPPPIRPDRVSFENRTPVVGATVREITAGS